VRKRIAPSARLFVLLPNATPLAQLLNPNVHLFVKNWNATTSVSNPPTAKDPNASYNARSLLVKKRNAAHAVLKMCNWLLFKPTMLAIPLLVATQCLSLRPSILSHTKLNKGRRNAALDLNKLFL